MKINLPDMLCVDSWLGMFCEYNLISHASAFSILPHLLKFGHLSRIRAHPIFFNIQIVCVQQPYTLFRYIISTYIMHKCTLILCIITHLQRFSDDEI